MFGIPLFDLAWLVVALLAAGAITGLLAGVFGVGGGAVAVPILYELFRILEVPEEVRMPLCVGTSLAIIIPTSLRSFSAHKAKGAVDMTILRVWAVPVVLGVAIGSVIARYAPADLFKWVFVIVAGISAIRLLFGKDSWRLGLDMPAKPIMIAYGWLIGILSALMGIGGGQLSNLFMTFYNRPIHQAVATSSGLGILISIPGALGYIYAGWPHMADYPERDRLPATAGAGLCLPPRLRAVHPHQHLDGAHRRKAGASPVQAQARGGFRHLPPSRLREVFREPLHLSHRWMSVCRGHRGGCTHGSTDNRTSPRLSRRDRTRRPGTPRERCARLLRRQAGGGSRLHPVAVSPARPAVLPSLSRRF